MTILSWLGRHLGPSIDVVPVMIAKISKENGQVLHRFTYSALIRKEWDRCKCKDKCSMFVESINQRLGHQATVNDLAK